MSLRKGRVYFPLKGKPNGHFETGFKTLFYLHYTPLFSEKFNFNNPLYA
jgi:hypothetical protein